MVIIQNFILGIFLQFFHFPFNFYLVEVLYVFSVTSCVFNVRFIPNSFMDFWLLRYEALKSSEFQ